MRLGPGVVLLWQSPRDDHETTLHQGQMMDLGLKDVHILVTGRSIHRASGGIGVLLIEGLETVRTYAGTGWFMNKCLPEFMLSYRTWSQSFGALHYQPFRRFADLTNESSVSQMFSNHEDQPDFGPVQIVVINHGIWPTTDAPIAAMSLDRWNHTIDTNLTSSFLVAREYLRQLSSAPEELKAKANIVFIGSTAGKYGEAGHADYAATKSAMMYGLTMSLKNEIVKIAPKGRVNCIAPGWVKTPMAEETLRDAAFVQRALATTPLKKVAEARDIANQIALISSPTVSGHVSGQVLMVDGGMEGRLLNVPSDF
ncbi:hypothetical protein EYR40_010134 [Pleurotus pulmonarius]|nr:hypothetical protein EYR40_010134 [Pleurotus pulmonarius]